MPRALERELAAVRETLLANPVSPRVETPRDINQHYCRYVAETVVERVGDRDDVEVVEDGARGFAHTWVVCDGRHYDAECVEGVDDYRALPFFRRHPEAALRPEPGSADFAALRRRGREPLYPQILSADTPDGDRRFDTLDGGTVALGGVVLGLALAAVGVAGEWSIHAHLLRLPEWGDVLFFDFEVVGVLLALLAPLLVTVLLADHRAS